MIDQKLYKSKWVSIHNGKIREKEHEEYVMMNSMLNQ